jgi:hypothetical protein
MKVKNKKKEKASSRTNYASQRTKRAGGKRQLQMFNSIKQAERA